MDAVHRVRLEIVFLITKRHRRKSSFFAPIRAIILPDETPVRITDENHPGSAGILLKPAGFTLLKPVKFHSETYCDRASRFLSHGWKSHRGDYGRTFLQTFLKYDRIYSTVKKKKKKKSPGKTYIICIRFLFVFDPYTIIYYSICFSSRPDDYFLSLYSYFRDSELRGFIEKEKIYLKWKKKKTTLVKTPLMRVCGCARTHARRRLMINATARWFCSNLRGFPPRRRRAHLCGHVKKNQ